ncbi:MAG: OsmC family protein, partial [Acidobacteriota bacterium]
MAEQTAASLEWKGLLRFAARSGSGHELQLDSPGRPGHQGPSPMELILIGVAGCTAIDVVAILGKMREPLEGLAVEICGERAAT